MLNWEAIARAESHPLRLAILELLLTSPPDGDPGWSAKTAALALDTSLARASHHMRELRDRGWLVEVGTRRARGAVETFYTLSGEVLGSGTVGGGCGLELGRFLQHDDVVELEIEGIGRIATTIDAPHVSQRARL